MTRERSKRFISCLMILIMLITTVVTMTDHTYAASTITVTYQGSSYSYTADGGKPPENMHGKFTSSGTEGAIYCAEHGCPTPMAEVPGASATLNMTEYTGKNANLIKKILYYGYGGPEQWSGFANSTYNGVYQLFSGNAATSKTEACGIAVTAMALTQAYGGNGRAYNVSGLSAFNSYISGKPVPTGFTIYRLYDNNSTTQDLFTWGYQPQGYLDLKKVVASDSSLVNQCPENYSLAGAVYNVYSNSSLTNKVGSFTTDKTGNADAIALDAGTYWVKEVKPSPGFALDTTTHKVTVKSDNTSTVTSKETPLFDPLDILLKKVDVGGNGDTPGLEGAQFTVKYYNKLTNDVSGLKPERTWVFQTNKMGIIQFRDSFKVGGDSLYKDHNGIAVGLIGTYVIQETKAPTGYVLNDETYIAQVRETGSGGHLTTFNTPIVPEERKEVRFNVVKDDADLGEPTAQGDATLAGAVFGLYEKDGTLVKQYTTDKNGGFVTDYYAAEYAYENELYLKEITPPDGYLLSEEKFVLDVDNPADIKVQFTTIDSSVNDEVIKGRIGLTKTIGGTDESVQYTPEKGAEFEVYLKSAGSYDAAADYEKDVITTDKDGYAETKDLPYGTYIVHQIAGTEGHKFVDDFEVTINENGEVYRYIMNNAKIRADLRVEKIDAETGKPITADGATFKIWSVDAEEWVSFEMKYPQTHILDTFETDETGSFNLPEPLKYGKYQLVEQEAPYGYVLSDKPIDFVVDGNAEAISIKAENAPQKGTISIEKTGEILASWTHNDDDTYTPVYEIGGIEGCTFDIYAKGDVITGDGTVRYTDGQKVATMTTDADGKGVSPELYIGEYTVVESAVAEGYLINTEEYNVKIEYAGQEVAITNQDLYVENERQTVEIDLKKTIETDKLFDSSNAADKIRFGLFAESEIVAADGSSVPAGGMIEQIGVEKSFIDLFTGEYTGKFTADLPIGNYYVQETATEEGYILDDTKYDASFKYGGDKTAVVEISINDGEPIANELIRGDIIGHKTTEDGNDLEGAVIGLFAADETEFTEANALLIATSGANGSFSFEDVVYGKYIVREITAPTGCVLNDTEYTVTIDKDGAEIEIEIENEFQRGELVIEKKGEILMSWKNNDDGTYTPVYEVGGLEGIEFRLTAAEDIYTPDNVLRHAKGDVIAELTTDEDGVAKVDDLYIGKYELTETKTAEGYVLDTAPKPVEIAYDGQTVEVVTERMTVENLRQNAEIDLTKAIEEDDVYGKLAADMYKDITFGLFAESEIAAADGSSVPAGGMIEQIGITEKDGKYTGKFTVDVPNGLYYVQEVATGDDLILSDEKYAVDLTYKDPEQDTIKVSVNDGEAITNELERGNIIGHKIGDKDKPLAGAEFGLFAEDETEFTRENAIKIAVSGDDGIFEFKDVPGGKWVIVELSAPEGYEIEDKAVVAHIKDDGQVIEFTAKNEPKVGRVVFEYDGGEMEEYVKTGDMNNVLPWALLLAVSSSALGVLIKRKKKDENEQ